MFNYWFELKHSLKLWRRHLLHLFLLPLILSATLVMLLFGLSLHQQVMMPTPSGTAPGAKLWSLALQDDDFQTTTFNPSQIRQLSGVLSADFKLAKLAFNELEANDG